MSEEYNQNFNKLKYLCQVVGQDVPHTTYQQAIEKVSNLLKNNYTLSEIIEYYHLDISLFKIWL